jgi:hypothetical protein
LTDATFLAPKTLGRGRHPISGLEGGFLAAYVPIGSEFAVRATLFDIWGHPLRSFKVSEDAAPSDRANPVVAALPDGAYAVAWSDFLGDGLDLGIAMRRVEPDAQLGQLRSATDAIPFPQIAPDLVWTGEDVVVAWVDYSDAETGPDIRYRRFDANLFPLTEERSLADSNASETNCTLVRFGDDFAAAYRETNGTREESIVVVAQDASFKIGPFPSAGLDESPALTALDQRHLLVVFSAGANDQSGSPSVLRYAVVDTTGATNLSSSSLPIDASLQGGTVSLREPAAEATEGGAYLAWTSTPRPSDPAGGEVWLKRLEWDHNADSLSFDAREMLAVRACSEGVGNQNHPVLARTSLPPGGGLTVAWDDEGRALGASAAPESVIRYSPTRISGEISDASPGCSSAN